MKIKDKLKNYNEKEWIVFTLLFLFFSHFLLMVIRYIWCIIKLDRIIVLNNPVYLILFSITPFFVWIYSTSLEYWNYRNRKLFLLNSFVINALLCAAQPLYSLLWHFIVPRVLQIKVTVAMTEGMIVNLARMLVFVPLFCSVGFIGFTILKIINSEEGKQKIYRFKLSHIVDTRKNKKNLYDLKNVVRDIHTGDSILLQEEDRKTAILLNGASGTGKTSSAIAQIIRDDMDTKLHNQNLRYKAYEDLLKANKAHLECFYDEFKEKYIKGSTDAPESINEVRKTYPNAGMTIMAPNNGYIEDVLKLARARGMKVNVLDPQKDWHEYDDVVVRKKMNPFYVPIGLSEEERAIQISNIATVFSEVLVAMNEQNKATETYFRDINTAVTSNIAIVVMLANNIEGRQTSILEIQICINDFMKLKNYVAIIKNFYELKIDKNKMLSGKSTLKDDAKARTDKLRMADGYSEEAEEKSEKNREEIKLELEKGMNNPYYDTLMFVEQELLSDKGFEKMFDQARGLRNLLTQKLLMDPRIKRLLNAQTEEERIDFDDVLENGEITVVNTAIGISQGISTAFGLFFQLNLRTAILRRPEKSKKQPHTLIIDECSQYVHPFFNDVIALYRQYGILTCIAVQSIMQLESKEATKFLKDVFMEAGTHIVYGRVGEAEMEMYSKLSGTKKGEIAQKTISSNSLLSENPSISKSERISPQREANLDPTDVRFRNFQEVTVFYTQNGDVMDAKLGKVSFLPKKAFQEADIYRVNWKEYMDLSQKEKANMVVKDLNENNKFEKKTVMTITQENITPAAVSDETDIAKAILDSVNEDK